MTKYTAILKLRVFIIISLGQFISLIGSGLTSFTLELWIYQKTGSITQFALVALFTTLPPILVLPIAGTLVDRWDKRWTMILSNCVAGLATLSIAVSFFMASLQVWQISAATSVISVCCLFQYLAFTATTTLLIPEKYLGRASGTLQAGQASIGLFMPALAGILVLKIYLQGILLIDFATYLFSLVMLLIVKFPKLKTATKTMTTDKLGKSSFKNEVIYGWTYINSHSGFLSLLLYFAVINFLVGIVGLLLIPMLLTFVSSAITGAVLSIGSFGALIGSLVMSVWGGPKSRVSGILGFGLLLGICIVFAGLRPSIPLITVAAFGGYFCFPLIGGCSQALLQSKVAVDVQGRVFAIQGMIGSSSLPLAYLVAGPLADNIFEPLLVRGGPLAASVGRMIGVGAGRGIGFLFIVSGILFILVTIYSYLYSDIRLLDQKTEVL
ncbi:MAG: MFS transporter [Nostoc sp.]|uniref:MFS transporter n=1 Tax=Nostoc sp. TaxID=1180 RepID=UPI002FF54935